MNKKKYELVSKFKQEKLLKIQHILDFTELGQGTFSALELHEALNREIAISWAEFRSLLLIAVTCELLVATGQSAGMFNRV